MFLEISQACNFIKKEIPAQVFSGEFCEFSKSNFFYRTLFFSDWFSVDANSVFLLKQLKKINAPDIWKEVSNESKEFVGFFLTCSRERISKELMISLELSNELYVERTFKRAWSRGHLIYSVLVLN